MQHEFQAAFEVSRLTAEYPCEKTRIRELRAAGRWVVVDTWLVYCRYTDAVLGTAYKILGDFATEAEARELYEAENGGDFEGPLLYRPHEEAPKQEHVFEECPF